MALSTLQDLYVEQLKDLYSAETQLVDALPLMAQAASAAPLRDAFQLHLRETEGHVQRLEQIFSELGENPTGKKCKAMAGLVAEGQEAIEERANAHVRDAALIAAAQRVEHYEIAGYGTVRTYAQMLNQNRAANLLQATLDEEGNTDHKLTDLAQSTINQMAENPKATRQA